MALFVNSGIHRLYNDAKIVNNIKRGEIMNDATIDYNAVIEIFRDWVNSFGSWSDGEGLGLLGVYPSPKNI